LRVGFVRPVTLFGRTCMHLHTHSSRPRNVDVHTVWRDSAPTSPRACEDGVNETRECMRRKHGVHGGRAPACSPILVPARQLGPPPSSPRAGPHPRCGDAQAPESTASSTKAPSAARHSSAQQCPRPRLLSIRSAAPVVLRREIPAVSSRSSSELATARDCTAVGAGRWPGAAGRRPRRRSGPGSNGRQGCDPT
jgi:hypothetical protein